MENILKVNALREADLHLIGIPSIFPNNRKKVFTFYYPLIAIIYSIFYT